MNQRQLENDLAKLNDKFRRNVDELASIPNQLHYDREYASLFSKREQDKKDLYARYGKNYKMKRYVEWIYRNNIIYNNSYANYPRPDEEQGFNVFENGPVEGNALSQIGVNEEGNALSQIGVNEEYFSNNVVPNNTNINNNPTPLNTTTRKRKRGNRYNNSNNNVRKRLFNEPVNPSQGGKGRPKKTHRAKKTRRTQRKRR
jgi:hypothetical protein